ncbi:MAG: radical SAM protein [Methylocystaceae bacterium]|nr:radical SAM protein [Methylocystaceae bacterium]
MSTFKHYISKVRQHGLRKSAEIALSRLSNKTYPSTINVEIMTVCNLKCRHCRVTYHDSEIPVQSMGFMEFDKFEEIAARIQKLIKHANVFQFSTIEPMFHKDLFKMMDVVSSYNPSISFPMLSNGLTFTEKKVNELLARNVPVISISIDGTTKEVVESFKTGIDFDKLINKIKMFREKTHGKISMEAVFVSTRQNIHQLVDYPEFVEKLGFDTININGFLANHADMANLYLYSEIGNNEVEEIYQCVIEKCHKLGLKLLIPSLKTEPIGCGLSSYMYIGEAGDVSPCVFLARQTPLELFSKTTVTDPVIWGNVLKQDPLTLWNEKNYSTFRNKLSSRNIPDPCKLCADAYGVICSNRTVEDN